MTHLLSVVYFLAALARVPNPKFAILCSALGNELRIR